MPKTRPVQELAFDGARLFCPDHPEHPLAKASPSEAQVRLVCLAPKAGARPCMRSAEWPSKNAMRQDLIKLALRADA